MNANDTLSLNYGAATITMPDGSTMPVLARKIDRGDGSFGWIIIDDKIMAYEASLGDTEFKPNDHLQPNTNVLDKKVLNPKTTTSRQVYADLVMFLGDPDRIIEQKGLDSDRLEHMKRHPASLTMARRLCQLSGPKWKQVLQYLPQFFPTMK